jgi:hypothetical protein
MTNFDKVQTGVLIGLGMFLLGCLWAGHQPKGLTQAPPELIHSARVYEDGSYVIEYKDGTSEVGCEPRGLCQD